MKNSSKGLVETSFENEKTRKGEKRPKAIKEKRANYKQNWRNLLDKLEE